MLRSSLQTMFNSRDCKINQDGDLSYGEWEVWSGVQGVVGLKGWTNTSGLIFTQAYSIYFNLKITSGKEKKSIDQLDTKVVNRKYTL